MAGRWTEEGELQLGVVGTKREMCLLLAGVKGALMVIIYVARLICKYNKLIQTEQALL